MGRSGQGSRCSRRDRCLCGAAEGGPKGSHLHRDSNEAAPSGAASAYPAPSPPTSPTDTDRAACHAGGGASDGHRSSVDLFGLRHDTALGSILRAIRKGALAARLDALEQVALESSGLDAEAPLVLMGGGASERTSQQAAARLSGRPLCIPRAGEVVAHDAAVQAAAVGGEEQASEATARSGLLGRPAR